MKKEVEVEMELLIFGRVRNKINSGLVLLFLSFRKVQWCVVVMLSLFIDRVSQATSGLGLFSYFFWFRFRRQSNNRYTRAFIRDNLPFNFISGSSPCLSSSSPCSNVFHDGTIILAFAREW
jgi:hypothetical protein